MLHYHNKVTFVEDLQDELHHSVLSLVHGAYRLD